MRWAGTGDEHHAVKSQRLSDGAGADEMGVMNRVETPAATKTTRRVGEGDRILRSHTVNGIDIALYGPSLSIGPRNPVNRLPKRGLSSVHFKRLFHFF